MARCPFYYGRFPLCPILATLVFGCSVRRIILLVSFDERENAQRAASCPGFGGCQGEEGKFALILLNCVTLRSLIRVRKPRADFARSNGGRRRPRDPPSWGSTSAARSGCRGRPNWPVPGHGARVRNNGSHMRSESFIRMVDTQEKEMCACVLFSSAVCTPVTTAISDVKAEERTEAERGLSLRGLLPERSEIPSKKGAQHARTHARCGRGTHTHAREKMGKERPITSAKSALGKKRERERERERERRAGSIIFSLAPARNQASTRTLS